MSIVEYFRFFDMVPSDNRSDYLRVSVWQKIWSLEKQRNAINDIQRDRKE